ncbi:putative GPI anchored protein [Penicillium digitatum]|nr:putative GPI anchored protein [Penicillium digitatum]
MRMDAITHLSTKHRDYPKSQEKDRDITPRLDWVNRVPGLDNGELIGAVDGFIPALESTGNKSYQELAQQWQVWMDYTKTTAAKIFYKGNGRVCTVIDIKDQSLPVNHPYQSYLCETKDLLDDPFEGEIFISQLQFVGGLLKANKQALRGFATAVRVRTCNSVTTKMPGMFASINKITDPSTGEVTDYISNAGIPSISNQTVQDLDVNVPGSVFPTILVDKSVGLAWWRNMVVAKKMQRRHNSPDIYGSTESTRVDGTAVSALLTWDSKVTTVIALLGGATDFVRRRMKADSAYDECV